MLYIEFKNLIILITTHWW